MNEDLHKHLEMIQGVINRMASNSFIIKGWSITAIGSLYAFWLSQKDNNILLLIFIVNIFFWLHDTYYLYLERGFRNLYDKVRLVKNKDINFDMTPVFNEKLYITAVRPVLLYSYGILTIITIVIIYISS